MWTLQVYIILVLSKYGLGSVQILSDYFNFSAADLGKILVFGNFDFLIKNDTVLLLSSVNSFPQSGSRTFY